MKKRIKDALTVTPPWSVNFRSRDVAVKAIDEAETVYGGDGRKAVVVSNQIRRRYFNFSLTRYYG